MANKPTKLNIRAYHVGFGDCFLLSWKYADRDCHILIDCGSNGSPKKAPKNLLTAVAQDIRTTTGGKLDAVVLTHRHKDHISGFATTAKGNGPGDIIRSMNPAVVVQPWTEDPKAAPGATQPTTTMSASQALMGTLAGMQMVSEGVVAEARQLQASEPTGFRKRSFATLAFLGEEGIKNASAVRNLQKMGKKHAYVSHGSKSGLELLLPGVKITVLGPPTLKQSDSIRKERHKDAAEFWMLRASAGQHLAAGAKRLFPGARVQNSKRPPEYARWFIPRVRELRRSVLLGIVRILDDAMNNTSVILLFEVNGQSFLFPGDAQIENWEYTLRNKALMNRLARVTFYKVGHHGSRNATPKSLWNNFSNRGAKNMKGRMTTVVSTMGDKYGKTEGAEVPRTTLMTALRDKTTFFSTQSLTGKTLSKDFPFDL